MKETTEHPLYTEPAHMPVTPDRAGLHEKIDTFMRTSRQIGDKILRSTVDGWEQLRQKNTVVRELTDTSLWKAEWDGAVSQVQSLPLPKVKEAYNTATAWVSTQYMIERGEAGILNPGAYVDRAKEGWRRKRNPDTQPVTTESTTTTTVNNKNFSRKTGVALAVVLGAGALYWLSETYPGNDVFGNRVFDPLDVDANLFDGEFSVDFFDQDMDGKVKMGGEQPLDTEAHQAFSDIKDGYADLAEELDQEIPDIDDGDWDALQDWGDELHELDDEVSPPSAEVYGPEIPDSVTNSEPSTPKAADRPTFYVEPTHGVTHEIMDYANNEGYNITPEQSYRIYQQLEAQHLSTLIDILHGGDDTYLDENGNILLSRAGRARWSPAAEETLRRALARMG